MAEQLDASKGWCCDGRTWSEHANQGEECCQPQGKRIEDLPPEAQQKARERVAKSTRA
jgi:hypothetical protein